MTLAEVMLHQQARLRQMREREEHCGTFHDYRIAMVWRDGVCAGYRAEPVDDAIPRDGCEVLYPEYGALCEALAETYR